MGKAETVVSGKKKKEENLCFFKFANLDSSSNWTLVGSLWGGVKASKLFYFIP